MTFGNWTTTDERLQELANRMASWAVQPNDGFLEIWDHALEYYSELLDQNVAEVVASVEDLSELTHIKWNPDLLLRAFEKALTEFDTIWIQSETIEKELDRGY